MQIAKLKGTGAPMLANLEKINDLRTRLNSVVLGQERNIESILVCLLAGGHVLMEGPPGVGKTSLAKLLSESIQAKFSRIQMTSDLLASDIVGGLRIQRETKELKFNPGPIFANILLADELNRGNPKTQAAMLEAMAERKVTVDGTSYKLPEPFFLIATQNPQENSGVYPLTESQLDRFMMLLEFAIPEKAQELAIYENHAHLEVIKKEIGSSLGISEILFHQENAHRTHIESSILEYVQRLAINLRTSEIAGVGISVRAVIQLLSAAKSRAYLNNRDYVIPEDIQATAVFCWAHKLTLNGTEIQLQQKRELVQNAIQTEVAPK